MSPFTFFLYAVAVSAGILIVGLAGIVVVGVFCYIVGGLPAREKTRS